MLAAIPADAIGGAQRVLEIGGGIGTLQAELLLRGTASGEVIELVRAYEPYAHRLATKLGIGDRTAFRIADLIDDPQQAEAADIVVMNRVVCCSADGPRLTSVAAGLTRGVLALSYPRSLPILRWAEWLQQPLARLFRRQYRFYIHDNDVIRQAATSTGMSLLATGRGIFWEYSVFGRPGWAHASTHHAAAERGPLDTGPLDTGPLDTGPLDSQPLAGRRGESDVAARTLYAVGAAFCGGRPARTLVGGLLRAMA